ncbi:hypothetical protein DENSPDRAFT_116522 [Dentipellis sp. KUC8613]|nr:hypothetical protein DENSPDRAFT_116522 [Dentipellis sp. KUC8613]
MQRAIAEQEARKDTKTQETRSGYEIQIQRVYHDSDESSRARSGRGAARAGTLPDADARVDVGLLERRNGIVGGAALGEAHHADDGRVGRVDGQRGREHRDDGLATGRGRRRGLFGGRRRRRRGRRRAPLGRGGRRGRGDWLRRVGGGALDGGLDVRGSRVGHALCHSQLVGGQGCQGGGARGAAEPQDVDQRRQSRTNDWQPLKQSAYVERIAALNATYEDMLYELQYLTPK